MMKKQFLFIATLAILVNLAKTQSVTTDTTTISTDTKAVSTSSGLIATSSKSISTSSLGNTETNTTVQSSTISFLFTPNLEISIKFSHSNISDSSNLSSFNSTTSQIALYPVLLNNSIINSSLIYSPEPSPSSGSLTINTTLANSQVNGTNKAKQTSSSINK
ncbi:unnamed protein product [Brachionus calyciflorus]|uniref:Uncharacterized protein n=1 Tax=Brachionus calyciflorus TaxID=104777 RepID=A0A814D1P1_9BILA|nr:unnamed protein product [Brachionus calyciflorus]